MRRFRPDGFSRKGRFRHRHFSRRLQSSLLASRRLQAPDTMRYAPPKAIETCAGMPANPLPLRNAPGARSVAGEPKRTDESQLAPEQAYRLHLAAQTPDADAREPKWAGTGVCPYRRRFAITQFCPAAQQKSPHASLSFSPAPTRLVSRLGGSDPNITVSDIRVN